MYIISCEVPCSHCIFEGLVVCLSSYYSMYPKGFQFGRDCNRSCANIQPFAEFDITNVWIRLFFKYVKHDQRYERSWLKARNHHIPSNWMSTNNWVLLHILHTLVRNDLAWCLENLFEDIGHGWDMALKCLRTFSEEVCIPKVIWGHMSCFLS